jgi:GT2 family glycosyltransferase
MNRIEFVLPFRGNVAENVATVIVNFNGWEDTILCIDSIQKSSLSPAYIVVVDNGSPNDSWRQLAAFYSQHETENAYERNEMPADVAGKICLQTPEECQVVRLILVQADKNGGFGAGNNIGVEELRRKGFTGYFWILNSDAEVLPDCLEILRQMGESARLPELVGTVLVDQDCPERVQACGAQISRPSLLAKHLYVGEALAELQARSEIVNAHYPIGASFLVHSTLFENQDLFDERYFLYFEEVALMHRLGMKSVPISTKAVVKHKGGAATGTFGKGRTWNALADFHSIRSRVIFGRQNTLCCTLGAVASGAAIALIRLWRIGPKGAKNALRGVWSGLRAGPAS